MKNKIVIVGTGLGGLVCGYILSKHGYEVTLLEKNKQIGGCLQSFRRNGMVYDTGMHYIGAMDEGQVLNRIFSYLDIHKDIQLRKLNEDGFDVVSYQGAQYRYAMGFERFADSLSNDFPHQHRQIADYVAKIRKVASESPLYNLREVNNLTFLDVDSIKTGAYDFIRSVTNDTVLQNVLAGTLPLYAGVRDKTPLYIHALINNLYIQSAYRIVGGSHSIANSLAHSIEKMGGTVLNNSEVSEFICDESKVTSVLLANGERIEADYFISNMHPQSTIDKLNTKLLRNVYRQRITNLENTISNFTVYLRFKDQQQEYMNSNFYHYNDADVWNCNSYQPQQFPHNYLYMHQASTRNDVFAKGALMISYMHFDEVRKWEGTQVGQRGAAYEDFKHSKAEKMIDALENAFPGIRSRIDSYSTSSPLTYLNYTASKDGSMYGVLRDKNFPTQTLVSQKTRIPNLFMTGQNINSHGILGVTIGAIITCSEFVGINQIINDIKQF